MFHNLLILSLICFGGMGATKLSDFFQTKNLALITWDHGVNNKTKLENALKTDVQMLEADVQLGSIIDTTEVNIPIMAHPPAKISDLSLDQFLSNISEYNAQKGHQKKGIKLDFKSIEAFNASIPILRNRNLASFPVWLNADILKGPGNPTAAPVDEHQFLAQSKQFPNCTLSVGWTTNHDKSTTNAAAYTAENVAAMMDTLKTSGIAQEVTFPVRAVYAAESRQQMRDLVANVSGATLTIWSADGDPVNVTNLQQLIDDIGVERVYVDVPKPLMDALDLSGAARPTSAGLLSVVLSALLFFK